MLVVSDFHGHIYPCYDFSLFFRAAVANLTRLFEEYRRCSVYRNSSDSVDTMFMVFLAERFDCHFFRDVRSGQHSLPIGYNVSADSSANNMLVICNPVGQKLTIISGRQIATSERLEFLALGIDTDIPDGLSAVQVLSDIQSAGGIPVLNWSPGKWFFTRGKMVRNLIEDFSPHDFLLGDTTLRPRLWPEPQLMEHARKKGFAILAGSDPLPFCGEEVRVGTYGSAFEMDLDVQKKRTDFVSLLHRSINGQSLSLHTLGTRNGVSTMCRRLAMNWVTAQ